MVGAWVWHLVLLVWSQSDMGCLVIYLIFGVVTDIHQDYLVCLCVGLPVCLLPIYCLHRRFI